MGTNLCHLESTEITVPDNRLFAAATYSVTARQGVACAHAECTSEDPSPVPPGMPRVDTASTVLTARHFNPQSTYTSIEKGLNDFGVVVFENKGERGRILNLGAD